jgi:hypothetical protein
MILRQLQKQAKKHFRQNPDDVNCFDVGHWHKMKGKTKDYIIENLPENLTMASNSKTKTIRDVSIPEGYFEFQKHTVSIESHTDDVANSTFMAMLVVDLQSCVKSRYDKRPLFTYFDHDNKKQSRRLDTDTLVVFNPRKNHQMMYFGYNYTVLLFSVWKAKGS